MNTNRTVTVAALNRAARTAGPRRPFGPHLQGLEKRQLMSATLPIDNSGPIDAGNVVTNGTQVYWVASHASGAGYNQVFVSDGTRNGSVKIVDGRNGGPSGFDNLVVTSDGTAYLTANANDGTNAGGHQVYRANNKGGLTKVTTLAGGRFYKLAAAGGNLYAWEQTTQKVYQINPANGGLTAVMTGVTSEPRMDVMGGNKLVVQPSDRSMTVVDGAKATKVANQWQYVSLDGFAAGEHYYFTDDENNFWRTNGTTTTKLTDGFSLVPHTVGVTVGEWTYFGGGHYNTSTQGQNVGGELYRVRTSDGKVELAANVRVGNLSSDPQNLALVGTSVYFSATDDDYLTSQGTHDRELYRYDTATGKVKKVTAGTTLAAAEIGAAVTTSYFFVASPTKDEFRYGAKALYRTNPFNDQIELVAGLPTSVRNGVEGTFVEALAPTGRGAFALTRSGSATVREDDMYFATVPFATRTDGRLFVQGTGAADDLRITRDKNDLVLTLNGVEQRMTLSGVKQLEIQLGAGDDRMTTDASVGVATYAFGDLGNDRMQGGGGADTLVGGAGKNVLWGGAGPDRLAASGGHDQLFGDEGDDRLYGNAGHDSLHGGGGVDRLFGADGDDWLKGGGSADKLYGMLGTDTLIGEKGNDLLNGGAGADLLAGGEGADFLTGAEGKDVFHGAASELVDREDDEELVIA